jgi:hypothetical protein
VQVRRNVLDVSYHVSQYQNIIAELKGEIERLKDKMNSEPVKTNFHLKGTVSQDFVPSLVSPYTKFRIGVSKSLIYVVTPQTTRMTISYLSNSNPTPEKV